MGFDQRDTAKPYSLQEGDTLQAIAERETADGNPLTWQDIARFNWGTDDAAEVNAFLRDELGARHRDADNNFVLASDDEPQGQLLIPLPFVRRGLALEQTYTLRVRKKTAPPQFLECCHLPGITFAFNSSFIRPDVVGYLKKLEAVAQRHPEAKVMIFGHTDAVDDDLYNKKLSERRAWSVYAFVTNDPDAWEVLYGGENWGLAVLQEILADLGHDPGPIDGDWGAQTRTAMRSFLGLPDDAPVQNDEAFRKQLFAAYMASKHDIDLPPERFMEPGYMGCGEFNLAEEREEALEKNRRVTFFFFHPERVPVLPCAYADTKPCEKQQVSLDSRHKPGFRCSFYDSLARRCHCEAPPQALASLEFCASPTAPGALDFVRFGLFDDAYVDGVSLDQDNKTAVLNKAKPDQHFIDRDSRHFHIRVKDPQRQSKRSVTVDWFTEHADGSVLHKPGDTRITLVETPPNSGVFISRGLMLVTREEDHAYRTHSGMDPALLPTPHTEPRRPGQSDHRLRCADLGAEVCAEYQTGAGDRLRQHVPLFQRHPETRKNLPLQVYVVRFPAAVLDDQGLEPADTGPNSGIWKEMLPVMRERYTPLGVRVSTVLHSGADPARVVRQGGDALFIVDAVAGLECINDADVILGDLFQNWAKALPRLPDTVQLLLWPVVRMKSGGFKIGGVAFASRGAGHAFGLANFDYHLDQKGHLAAHEIGHLLTDKGHGSSKQPGHYVQPDKPTGNRLFEAQNLMANGGPGARLWDVLDKDNHNQMQSILDSPFLRPFSP